MIRQLVEKDYPSLIELWIRADLEYRPNGRDCETQIHSQMKINPDSFWGYFLDNNLIGSMIVTDDGRKGWVNRIAVHPDYRRKGIAKEMIQFAEELLSKKGIFIVAALIYNSNKSSLTLFEQAGYEVLPNICYLRHVLKEGI